MLFNLHNSEGYIEPPVEKGFQGVRGFNLDFRNGQSESPRTLVKPRL